jgi:glycosyltransferase involved in cell wall biosynthesis
MNNTISIIVTSYTTQQLKDIIELLDSIKTQSYPNVETIFVVERSQELYTIIKAQEKEIPNLKVIFNDATPGMSASRNLGIKESMGQIVAFVDDDAVLTQQWAEETAKAYDRDEGIIGLTGPIVPLWEEPSMAWFPREFYWIFSCTYYDWTEPTNVRNGYGTNISFKREAFNRAGLFLTNLGYFEGSKSGLHLLTSEETEFSMRVTSKTGYRILYHPSIKVIHKVYKYRFNLRPIAKRAYRVGYTKAIFKKLYANYDNVLNVENDLLKQIFLKLFPDILKRFFYSPRIALRRLSITIVVLSSVASGYLSGVFKKTTV